MRLYAHSGTIIKAPIYSCRMAASIRLNFVQFIVVHVGRSTTKLKVALYCFTVVIASALLIIPLSGRISFKSKVAISGFAHNGTRIYGTGVMEATNSIPDCPADGLEVRHNGTGYVLALGYSDQLTAAAMNVESLMCLATEWGRVRPVEPFVIGSTLGLDVKKNWTKLLKFSDIFDGSMWTKRTSHKRYNQLVPFSNFIKEASKKVILVQYYHPCGDKNILKVAQTFCKNHGFELVQTVCLTYSGAKRLTTESIKKQIYSCFKPNDVVVLFEIYGAIELSERDISRGYRIYADNKKCSRHSNQIEPSPTVFSDADLYIQKYLNGSSSYVSLMVRVEHLMLKNKCHSSDCLRTCLNAVISKWREIKNCTGLTTTFLAIDAGTYGSSGLKYTQNRQLVMEPVNTLFSIIFDNKTTLREWEETFTTVALGKKKTSGYIAMIQKAIAVKGNALFLAGSYFGSSFQMSTRALYHKIHPKGQIFELYT